MFYHLITDFVIRSLTAQNFQKRVWLDLLYLLISRILFAAKHF